MNSVVIDGVSYTKASILAKKFRYTADYLGQLCRSGKVDAQLVGRAWYVNEASLEHASKKRINAIRRDEILLENSANISESLPITVSAPVSKKTTKGVFEQNRRAHQFPNRQVSLARYESDEVDLLPLPKPRVITPNLSPENRSLEISTIQDNNIKQDEFETAESRVVTIETFKKTSEKLHFTELPKIPLTGSVAVQRVESPTAVAQSLSGSYQSATIVKKSVPPPLPLETESLISDTSSKIAFQPASVGSSVPLPRYVIPHIPVAIALFFASCVVFVLPVVLDVEVTYDGNSAALSLSINHDELIKFFRN